MAEPQFVTAETYHGRRGEIKNSFRYNVDLVLMPMRSQVGSQPRLFSIKKWNLFSFYEKDYGNGDGDGVGWIQSILDTYDLSDVCDGEIWLLTQPRFLGYFFNPVSFWFCLDRQGSLRAVVAEVNNTFGDRHTYLCRRDDKQPIQQHDRITAQKAFHVSPFQTVKGRYSFRFQFDEKRVGAWIDLSDGGPGLYANLTGSICDLTDKLLVLSAVQRPFGAIRVIVLIFWQALKLKIKGARYVKRPAPPSHEVTL